MIRISKILSVAATICALHAGPLHAQSEAVRFTTSFPFYVSSQKMPAGTYTARKLDIDSQVLLIRDVDSSHSAVVQYHPTQSIEPVSQGKVTFHQYGDADYLSGFTLTGDETGMQLPESIGEKRAALAEERVASTRSVALQSGVPGY